MIARHTKQREIILRILRATTSHPTADEIYQKVRDEIPNLSKGTVYRNLKVLQSMRLISRLDLEGVSVGRFDANPSSHYHFRCEKCARVFDIDIPVSTDEKLKQHIARITGHIVSYHRLEFHGICHTCKRSTVIQTNDES